MKWICCIGVTWILFVSSVHALDPKQVDFIAGMNCSSYLKGSSVWSNSTNGKCKISSPLSQCPPWYCPSQDDICRTGDSLNSVVNFHRSGQTWLLPFNCMTTSQNITHRKDVVGGCFFSTNDIYNRLFFPLPCNISELNEFMCAGLNREGQLCGKCKKGYAPAVYSYVLRCINCTDYSYNWLKYTAVAFGPLTIFCIIIIVFHISATSPYLHGFILYCHLVSTPTILRLLINSHGYIFYQNMRTGMQVYFSLTSIWSLDFFRLVYKPFCLYPSLTIIQSLALDYLVAVYPLILIGVTYVLVSLHNHSCKLVVALWNPFRKILRPFLHNLDINTTLIESFATLYLLSIMKTQCVSLDLLVPTTLYYMDGSHDNKLYLYLAGDVEYFGEKHLPYAFLATIMSLALVIFPMLLLFLYPCRCFQNVLNKTHLNSHALRTFMDVFQGHYKNGTEKSHDYRCFSGVFLAVRFVLIITFTLFNSYVSAAFVGLIVTVFGFSVALIHPQRSHIHYVLDSIFLLLLSVIFFFLIGDIMGAHNAVPSEILRVFGMFSAVLPLLHITALLLYWIIQKKRIPQKGFSAVWTTVAKAVNSSHNSGQYRNLMAPS